MIVKYLFLAQSAEVDGPYGLRAEGIGVRGAYFVSPKVAPQLSLVISLEAQDRDMGYLHHLNAVVVDRDYFWESMADAGKDVCYVRGFEWCFSLSPGWRNKPMPRRTFVVDFSEPPEGGPLLFESGGDYAIDLYLDGEHIAEVPFELRLKQKASQGS